MNTITKREKQVLDHISQGFTTRELAAALYVSNNTILSHRKNLLCKLDAKNTAELVRKGFEYGFLSLSNSLAPSNSSNSRLY